MEKNWHKLSVEEVLRNLGSHQDGLSPDKARERLEKFGPNSLPREKPFSELKIFLDQLRSPLIYFLIIAGITTLLLKDYTDTIVILAAVFLNTIIGYFQENKASKALEKLKQVLKVKATVVREGLPKEILQEELVLGDIILLKAGDKVPADSRLIEVKNLKINQASLTGEWLPVDKNPQAIFDDVPMAERQNLAYMGTLVESGFGKAIVIATGMKTEIGKVAKLVKETKEEKTPYQKKLIHFGRVVAAIIIILSALIFIWGILRGETFIDIFTTTVAIAVAAIPEGLPVAMTVVLALGMQRILKRKGLVRRLAAAEALGSTSIICVDKTGTLTEGKMAVCHILTGSQELLNNNQDIFQTKIQESHLKALEIAALCSEAYVENPQDEINRWVLRGRPTDRALTSAAIQAGISWLDLDKKYPRIDRLEFHPDRKISASLNKFSSQENFLFCLGAPEKIINMSTKIESNGQQEEIIQEKNLELNKKYQLLTGRGLRVLATAYQKTQAKEIEDKLFSQLIFVGFIALRDPLRPETKEVVAEAKSAGLRPIIVTGDHRLTAKAIAQELDLPSQDQNILDGQELAQLSNEELKKKVAEIEIYARVEPAQKLKIVQAWQSRGEVVAMTGDGINDAPALKKADIGLALGSGTQVAKEVADIVLLNDNFQVIVSAIEEGRGIIDNIRKSIVYLIADSFSEISLISLSLLFGWPLPVLAAQILWINLIEDGLPTIALAFEPKEKDLMKRRPNPRKLPLLTKEMKMLIFVVGMVTMAILGMLFYWLFKFTNYPIEHIRTVIFAAMALITLFYVFSCKTLRKNIWQGEILSNKFLIFSWFGGVITLILAIYLPPLQKILQTVPLSSYDWTLLVSLSLINLAIIELVKYILNRSSHGLQTK